MTPEEMVRLLDEGRDPLDLSIQKWQDIVDKGSKEEKGWQNCALCYIYWYDDCEGCIINKAGHHECKGTPYDEYVVTKDREEPESVLKKIAIRELQFLKSLKETKNE